MSTRTINSLDAHHRALYYALVNMCRGYEYPYHNASIVLYKMHLQLPVLLDTYYNVN